MKKSVFLLVVIISLLSCQKEEMLIPINAEEIRSELLSVPAPTKEEVQQKIAGQNLKSAGYGMNEGPVMVRIFALDEQTYEIYNDYVVKYLVYYEINYNGYREKLLTLRQEFRVQDGKIVLDGYSLDISVGCNFSRDFYLKDQNNVSQITSFFHFENGEEFAYFMNGSGLIKLPPIAGGLWQVSVEYNDGDMNQKFLSDFINFYEDVNINLRFNLKSNLEKINLKISADYVLGASFIQIVGEDENGDYQWCLLPIPLQTFDDIVNLQIPFNPKRIYICGENGCNVYTIDDIDIEINITNGVVTYKLM